MTPTTPAPTEKPDLARLNEPLQQRLMEMAAAEKSALQHAIALLPAGNRRAALRRLQLRHARELEDIVANHGWPTVPMVGQEPSAYCLQLLLVCENLAFQTRCRNLIEAVVADRACPAAQFAFIADRVAVAWSLPQQFGTQINPITVRPYPVASSHDVDERRMAVGLAPLGEVLESYRARLRGEATPTSGRRASAEG
ncbi:DUF6624 domain-containing protein [Streptomyces sp. NBC_01006]|uniref:DUF6624 domain-containing protein n=1 Tax=Streptomyces sp. NBC_01006 TaxID=2903716 RepID=UPI0038683F54|nr:hypothetical protein OG509_32930 [Streptomyces sp. NBC_01006]